MTARNTKRSLLFSSRHQEITCTLPDSEPEGKRPLGRLRRRWEDNTKDGSSGSGRGFWGLDGVGSG